MPQSKKQGTPLHPLARKPKILGSSQDQLQFVLGVEHPSTAETVSVFGLKAFFGAVAGWAVTDNLKTASTRFTDLTKPVAGMMIKVKLQTAVSLEVDGLVSAVECEGRHDSIERHIGLAAALYRSYMGVSNIG